jgi:hypothetical protein
VAAPEAAPEPLEEPLDELAEAPLPWEERAGTVARRIVVTALVAIAVGGVAAIRASGAKHLAPAPTPAARAAGGPLVMALTEPTPGGAARGALSAHLDSLGAIAPDWARLTADGTFRYTAVAPSYAALVARGERIVPVVRDPDGRAPGILSDPALRARLVTRLADALSVLGAAGVVLDIPDVPAAARRDYPELVRALAERTRRPVYVAVPAFPNEEASHADWGYDLRDLARPATLLVRSFAEHDEHTEAGPIASLEWFRSVVRYTLQNAPRSRVVLGIADYGMTWDAFGRARRVTAASVYPRLGPDAAAQADGGQVYEGGGKVTWVEQDRSLALKLRVAENAKVAGVAFWIRGGESSNLWQAPLVAPSKESKGS